MPNGNGEHHSATSESGLHVAIIMDGSGRWAEARGLSRAEGHRAGRAAVRRVVQAALESGIRVLTLFTFSSDNWGRPANEVSELMQTFEEFFRADAPALAAQGARVTAIGRRDRLPMSLRTAIEKVEGLWHSRLRGTTPLAAERGSILPESSDDGDEVRPAEAKLHVRFAIDYSGRGAILEAARLFSGSSDDSAGTFARLLAGMAPGSEHVPDIDLLIRTGGELRLSNCPLWEIAYAELYFTPCLWPDFGPAELDAALQEFQIRHRRFGRISTVASCS